MTPLLEQLVARPDDLELRRVIADQLQAAGDPHGELIAVQCALATTTDDKRAALRMREAELIRSGELGKVERAMRAHWRLGFVYSATLLEDVVARLPTLLAHPAMRLVEELAVAAEPHELAAIGEAIRARPQPSRLRSVVAGPPGPDRDYIARTDAPWLAPLAALLPELATLPAMQMSTAAFEAHLASHHLDIPDYWLAIEELAPKLDYGRARLRARPGCGESIARRHAAFPPLVRPMFEIDASGVTFETQELARPIACADVYRAIRELAPYVEDVRFALGWRTGVLEIAIEDGAIGAVYGTPTSPHIDATYDYWDARLARQPGDYALRDYVLWRTLSRARAEIDRLSSSSPDERERGRTAATQLLDRAAALYEPVRRLWELRGRLARELGDAAEATRCFARLRTLGDGRADFDLALAAFTQRDDGTARSHVAHRIATAPQHTGALALAAYLARTPAEAAEHLAALAAVVEQRRIQMTPFAELEHELWPQLEPDLALLVATGRYRELAGACVRGLALVPSRVGAAAYLCAWAEAMDMRYRRPPPLDVTPEQFIWRDTMSPERERAEQLQERQKTEAAALAVELFRAAAALDPLAGTVHHRWAAHARSANAWDDAIQLLERALAINPHHAAALEDRATSEHDPLARAALYERYVATLRLLIPLEGERGRYCPHPINRVCDAYLERTCLLLYGDAEWNARKPVQPAPDALATAEAALAAAEPALAQVTASLAAVFGSTAPRCTAIDVAHAVIALARGDHGRVLEHLDRSGDDDELGLVLRAQALLGLGRYEEAHETGRDAARRQGRIPRWPAHFIIACAAAALGRDRSEVIERLDHVLAIAPFAAPAIAEARELAAIRDEPDVRRMITAAAERGAESRIRYR